MRHFWVVLWVGILFWGGMPASEAKEIMKLADQVQKTYEQTGELSLEFLQKTFVAVLEREIKKKGKAHFKKPGKFLISYQGEQGRQYQSNGKKLWIYQMGDKKVQAVVLNEETVPAEALSFLGGLGNLKQDFAVEEVEKKKWVGLKPQKKSLQWMELTPLKKRSNLKWLVMGFDAGDHLAREVFLFTESGNLSHYVFTSVQPNSGVKDSVFDFGTKK